MDNFSASLIATLVASPFIIYWLVKRVKRARQYSIAHQRARTKRAIRDKRRQELLHLLRTKYSAFLPDPVVADFIGRATATKLIEGLRTKHFTYTQVTLVLCLRALKAGLETNCVTEEFYDEVLERAKEMDENDNINEEQLLKGIPISVKEVIDQRGADSAMGMSMRNLRPAARDSLILELLNQQGALCGFARTTTVQGMLLADSGSETYGSTLNLFNKTRTPGGSSGGEGALIACRGSVLGLGSDIGGSIRIPAHFCGIFGFKPTPGRITMQGVAVPAADDMSGETNLQEAVGPLGRCTDDLVLVIRSWLQPNMWFKDPELARQPWREDRFTDSKRLTIGFYTNDSWFPASPACIRAVNEAADALRQLGHTLVPYTPFDVTRAVRIYMSILGADGERYFFESIADEPMNPLYKGMYYSSIMPNFLRPLVVRLLRIFGQRRQALMIEADKPRSTYEYFDLIMDMKRYKEKWLEDMRTNKIDLLLTPVNALPAYRHSEPGDLSASCSYTLLFNILNLPAGVVPVTLVREDEQFYENVGDIYNDSMTSKAKKSCRESAGLPIGVQLAGWPNDDERVLNIMRQLEHALPNFETPMPQLAKDIDIFLH